jgi:hypothetical protein
MNTPKSLAAVMDFFRRNGWKYESNPDHPILRAGFGGQNGTFLCVVAEDEADDFLQVITIIPLAVPTHKRAAVGELCLRLSYPLMVGGFQMDMNDGEVRFRSYSVHAKGELPEEVIRRVLHTSLAMADQHFPAFVAVLFSDVPAEEAAHRVGSGGFEKAKIPQEAWFQPPPRLNLN